MTFSYSIPIPLDGDGFLRRECPHCRAQFKVHHGPTADRPEDFVDPPVYHCPLCGEPAGPDHWWTEEQLEYAREAAMGPVMEDMSAEIAKAFRGVKGVTFTPGRMEAPEPPAALHEPDDMVMVAPPCHPWEPIKVPPEAIGHGYCVLCGSEFAS